MISRFSLKLSGMMLIMGFVLLLTGCSGSGMNPIKGHAVIDWVDFVKLNGYSYTGLHNKVIKDSSTITSNVVGQVQFKVADVVSNPSYKTKDGDAAFLDIGTKLFEVQGFKPDELIAVKDQTRIGGYRLYAEDSFAKSLRHHYGDMPKADVERIELYRGQDVVPYTTLQQEEKDRFIELLDQGTDTQSYSPNQAYGDPFYFKMVFYTDELLGYTYNFADDGVNVYFHPWETRIVDGEIRRWLP